MFYHHNKQAVKILSNGDRIGGNLSTHLATIFYAHKYNLPLIYGNRCQFDKSIFIKAIQLFLLEYNKNANITNDNIKSLNNIQYHTNWYAMQAQTLSNIKEDYITYFKKHFYINMRTKLDLLAKQKGYIIPFDKKKTILVHLRLNDVAKGYKGSCRSAWPEGTHATCNDVYKNYINNDDYNSCHNICEYRQCPIEKEKLLELLGEITKKYPDREVILITSPGENIDLPYKVITNNDESLDLYLLCNSEIILTSRSTFGFIPLLFGIVKEAWVPKWCHFAMFGLTTKYDKNKNLNFY